MSAAMPCANVQSSARSSGWQSISATPRRSAADAYIHPEIFAGFLDGTLLATAERTRAYMTEEIEGMSAEEAAVTGFLRLRFGELAQKAA